MTTFLAVLEGDGSVVDKTALEVVSLAAELAAASGASVHAAVVAPAGSVASVGGDTRATLGAHGVSVVHAVAHPLLEAYAPAAWGEAIVQLADALGAAAVLASGSERGNEVMAHAAADADLPLATGCVEVAAAEEGWTLVRQRWGGMLLEEARLVASRKLLTIAPHSQKITEVDAPRDPAVEAFAPVLDDTFGVVRVVDRVTEDEGVSLATAPVVVAGGRGVGSADGFAVLEELAELLGGAVGCSRVATNNGWRPHSDQVGQTGMRVAPDLYVACGISGATQHWVGCMNAKRILAINTDPDAPMVTRAHYAVVGDVAEVLPAVVAELRRRAGAMSATARS
jgi:electron transfer flavoprotein alpha subunit